MYKVSPLIETFAEDNNLKLKVNPFHASEGIEMRKSQGRNYICIGFIRGPKSTEVYRRTIRKFDVLLHEKLWVLDGLTSIMRNSVNDYTQLEVFNGSEFFEPLFIKIIVDQLKRPAEGSAI